VGGKFFSISVEHITHPLCPLSLQLNSSRYPTWRSLAGDYLTVMVSSVASEHAFSSAGITISKRRNRLDSNIIEALQCLKSLKSQDVMQSAAYPSVADEELLLDKADLKRANQEGSTCEIVDEVEDWSIEAVVKDAGDEDATDNNEVHEVIVIA
jgi:hypothetical protein